MSFIDVMTAYFRGEKLEALFFILPIGLFLVALAAVALKVERGGFAWGVAIPSAIFALVMIATGVGVVARSVERQEKYSSAFATDQAYVVQEELPRMRGVSALFRATLVAFGVAAAVGLCLIYLVGSGWAKGTGSVLVLIGGIGSLVDGFADRRSYPYLDALEVMAKQHDVPLDGAGQLE